MNKNLNDNNLIIVKYPTNCSKYLTVESGGYSDKN